MQNKLSVGVAIKLLFRRLVPLFTFITDVVEHFGAQSEVSTLKTPTAAPKRECKTPGNHRSTLRHKHTQGHTFTHGTHGSFIGLQLEPGTDEELSWSDEGAAAARGRKQK